MELYFPHSEYDFETVSAVLYGFLSTIVMVLVTLFACFPDSKIPIVSNLFAKVNQFEKKNIRSLANKVSWISWCWFGSKRMSCSDWMQSFDCLALLPH